MTEMISSDAACLLPNQELQMATGGLADSERSIIIDWSVRGLVVNWAASCSNNLRPAAVALEQKS